jgi:hypothetical protein
MEIFFSLTRVDDPQRVVIGSRPYFALPRHIKALSLVYIPVPIHFTGIIIQL